MNMVLSILTKTPVCNPMMVGQCSVLVPQSTHHLVTLPNLPRACAVIRCMNWRLSKKSSMKAVRVGPDRIVSASYYQQISIQQLGGVEDVGSLPHARVPMIVSTATRVRRS